MGKLEQSSAAVAVPRHWRKLLGTKGCASGAEVGVKVGVMSVPLTSPGSIGVGNGGGGFAGKELEQPHAGLEAPPRRGRRPVRRLLPLISK